MPGRLTTHVLDTSKGRPAAGLRIALYRQGDPTPLTETITNADGRTDEPLLPEDQFATGAYELVFHAGDYLKGEGFYDQIPIRFTMTEDAHHHVPLLLSPFGYSTYRGS